MAKYLFFILFIGLQSVYGQNRKAKPSQTTLSNGLEIIYIPSEDNLVHINYVIHMGYSNVLNFTEHSLQLLKYTLLSDNANYTAEDIVYANSSFGKSLQLIQHANDLSIMFDCKEAEINDALDFLSSMLNSATLNKNFLMAAKSNEKSNLFNPYTKTNTELCESILERYLIYPNNQLIKDQFDAQNVDGLNSIFPLLVSANNSTLIVSYAENNTLKVAIDSAMSKIKSGIPFPVENTKYRLDKIENKSYLYLQHPKTTHTTFSFIKPAPVVGDKDYMAFIAALYCFNRYINTEIIQRFSSWIEVDISNKAANQQGFYAIHFHCLPEDEIKINAFWDELSFKFYERGISIGQTQTALQELKQKIANLTTEETLLLNNPFLYGEFNSLETLKDDIQKLSEKDLGDALKNYFAADAYYCLAIAAREPFGNSIVNFKRLSLDQLDAE